jgi:hypothetical protein
MKATEAVHSRLLVAAPPISRMKPNAYFKLSKKRGHKITALQPLIPTRRRRLLQSNLFNYNYDNIWRFGGQLL